ncbi:hypothetical protein F442_01654 [Phytophthora nicotianae P10297]|uniref:Uncharacterized protein n=1 Tax=Phytophthora nicotianae P10297 TaxID=1317064 RepID=W3A2H4_PHYNI|nr:hypothetical protein F442_01654 [Phytophthora nicotianae P10297]
MSKKGGFSKEFMELIHEGMMSPHGLSSTVDHIRRRREKRYYKLLCLFGDQVGQLQLSNRTYLALSPPSVGQYCSKQNPVGAETMSAAWMQSTNIYSYLCEQVMNSLKVQKALRVDHSVKFCQILGRRLTRSENHDETRELLLHVRSAFSGTESGSKYVISDHANGIRNLVSNVFDSSVGVRQDPFHVIQRFTENIKDQKVKKTLSKQLHDAMVSVDGALREPTQMSSRFLNVVGSISSEGINCSESEWQGSVNSNLKQIERGDLYLEDNIYREGGGKDVRVVSTSQLEGFHSALNKMLARSVSADIGLRILDIFILQHNLKVSSNYGRNPPMHHADIPTLAQTATLCRGIIAESPQLEFVNQLLSKPLRQPAYRASTVLDYGFERWRQIFETARVDTQTLEANFHHTRQHNDSIKELLLKRIAFTENAAAGFSSQERALLRQVQTEQKLARRNWSECPLVTTLMYNIVVSSNSNQRPKLRRRSFATLAPKINSLTIKPTPGTKESTSQRLFRFVSADPCSEIKPREQELLAQLFSALRRLDGVRKRRQVFVMVYDFASCVCTGIHPKTRAALLAKWNNMKQQANNAKLKLKFKLSPEMKAIISSSRSDSENGGQISHFRSCSASISSSTVGMNYFNATNAH